MKINTEQKWVYLFLVIRESMILIILYGSLTGQCPFEYEHHNFFLLPGLTHPVIFLNLIFRNNKANIFWFPSTLLTVTY